MSAKDAITPRVFLVRHGETEWSKNGRYTGITDLPLLPEGEARVRQTASVVFGHGRLIDPSKIIHTFASPRQRAQRTLELLLEQIAKTNNEDDDDHATLTKFKSAIETTEDIAEFGYGDYEGLLTHQIRQLRKDRGLDKDRKWDIGRDGTEGQGGESAAQVTERLDRLIARITEIQADVLKKQEKGDILVVAHGHILRFFVKRWLGLPLDSKLELMLEPGGVCGLSYAHGNIDERAVLVGMSFPGAG